MSLYELAGQYRDSSAACRLRVKTLRNELASTHGSETQKIRMRRRITILTEMARDASATAKYLESYYIREARV